MMNEVLAKKTQKATSSRADRAQFLIKLSIFTGAGVSSLTQWLTYQTKDHYLVSRTQMLRPNEKAQHEMVINGLADVLMRVADGEEAIFCLPGRPGKGPTPSKS